VDIDYDGGVHFCIDNPEYLLGNIKDDTLLNIFNNPTAVAFRKILRDQPHGVFPGCSRCYQLMLLGRENKSF
jgi:sulfatase maturation enzyme AslB (radical SAM superfamily)